MNLTAILSAFGVDSARHTIVPFGNGLINHTWKIYSPEQSYILQRINTDVFSRPEHIAYNIRTLADYLQQHHPGYRFIAPIKNSDGSDLYRDPELGCFRLFPFVADSRSYDVVTSPTMAYEAARQFARFTCLLSGLDATALKTTLPDFHNLPLRYKQFRSSIKESTESRRSGAHGLINYLLEQLPIVHTFEAIPKNSGFRKRVIHHDTKISNVLFDNEGRGLCVIDLDTVMPGYFISDVGDMMRTYLSPVSEEERDFTLIDVREDYFLAIVEGYLSEMHDQLSAAEKESFMYAGKFMIYMQALRFLTDHLHNDAYYGARYEGHNLVRAQNQAVLLQRLQQKEVQLSKKIGTAGILTKTRQ